MRIPLAPAGVREMAIMTLLFGGTAGVAYAAALGGTGWCWPVGAFLTFAWLAGLAFFRDPQRVVPGDPDVLVGPADGRVDEVVRLEHDPMINGPATRISIFLSVFDVHVNRSPCSGVVKAIHYKPGKFLDARHGDAGRLNESNTIIIEPDAPHDGPFVLRQVAGLLARRIVCDIKVGDRLEAGQRIGMIKFGSRTELIVPGHDRYEPAVKVGDRSRGAVTVLARRCPCDVRVEPTAVPARS